MAASRKSFGPTRKAQFLELYAESGRAAECAAKVGVSVMTVLQVKDPNSDRFDPDFAVAFEEADALYLNLLEKAAHDRAVDGIESVKVSFDRQGNRLSEETTTKYSDSLLAKLLVSRSDKYRDKVDVQKRVTHSGQVQLSTDLTKAIGTLSKEGKAKLKDVLRELCVIADEREMAAAEERDGKS